MIKKLFVVSLLALTAVAFAPSSSVTTAGEEEIHLHSVAEARSATWQCRNCGEQRFQSDKAPAPRQTYGCGGQWNKSHVWERID